MVFTHRRPGLWQNRQSPATVRLSTVIRRAKKEACGLQQGPYPHRSSSPVRGPCNAPGLLPLGSGTLRAAANWVTRPGFLNAALQASDWGNSSWLCQSRKGGLYPVPGLEVAQADLEAMGRGMGFRMKVLTHWENLAARGSSEGWDPAGPALGARLAAVSSRRAVMTFVRRQDPVPCSGGGFARRLRVQRASKARAVPRCSLLGPQHVHSTGMGIGARGSSHPGQLTGGAQGGPNLACLVPAIAKFRGWGNIRTVWGAQPGLTPALVGSRATGCQGGSRAVPALGTFPIPGWAWEGCSAPGAAVLWRRKWQRGEGKGCRGSQGAPAVQGTFWSWVLIVVELLGAV